MLEERHLLVFLGDRWQLGGLRDLDLVGRHGCFASPGASASAAGSSVAGSSATGTGSSGAAAGGATLTALGSSTLGGAGGALSGTGTGRAFGGRIGGARNGSPSRMSSSSPIASLNVLELTASVPDLAKPLANGPHERGQLVRAHRQQDDDEEES
jgi:hypothetical protein